MRHHLNKGKVHFKITCLGRLRDAMWWRRKRFLGLVLDAGCGGNISARKLTSKGFGADVSVDIRKPIVRIRDFVRASVCHLPFAGNAFSESIASHVLEHLGGLDQIRLAVHELRRTSFTSHVFVPTWYAFGNASPEHKLIFIDGRFHNFPRVIESIMGFLWLPFRNRYSRRFIKPVLERMSQEHYFRLKR